MRSGCPVPRRCPLCCEQIADAALVCMHCQSVLTDPRTLPHCESCGGAMARAGGDEDADKPGVVLAWNHEDLSVST